MPGKMTGVDLAHDVRHRWPSIPIILVSGYSEHAQAAKNAGFIVLPKPLPLAEFENAVLQSMRCSEDRWH